MSLFGVNNAKPATGLFGSTQPSQPSGGLFGSTNTSTNQQQTAPGGFGSLTLQQPQQPQQQQQQQPQQQPAGGGLFGGGQAQSGGLFGGGTGGGGAFGASGTGTGSGLFGNTGASTGGNAAGPSTGGGIFGNANTNTNNTNAGAGGTGGGLFGNTNNTGASNFFSQPPAGSNPSPFGQQPQQQQQQQQPQQQQGSSLFGSLGQNQNNQAPSFGSFGSFGQPQSSTTNPSGASGLFASANPLTLSSLSQPAPTGSLFGPKPTFPSSSSFLPGSQSQQPSDNSAQAQSAALQQRIEAVVAAWNPQSPQCRFQYYFYNQVDSVSTYGRPANFTNDSLWQQATRENPDPSSLVPTLAIGFDDLQKRIDAQGKKAAFHQEKLKELQARLAVLAQTHLLANTLRTTRALQTHTLITHRLLRLLEHIHLLIPALRSAAISPEEEELRARLERLRDDVLRGVGGGGGRGHVNELWALLGAVKAAREGPGRDGVEWKVVDQEGLERLSLILSEQQQGLAHLTNIIHNDMKDLQVMEIGAGAGAGESVIGGNSPHRGLGASQSVSGSGLLQGRR